MSVWRSGELALQVATPPPGAAGAAAAPPLPPRPPMPTVPPLPPKPVEIGRVVDRVAPSRARRVDRAAVRRIQLDAEVPDAVVAADADARQQEQTVEMRLANPPPEAHVVAPRTIA